MQVIHSSQIIEEERERQNEGNVREIEFHEIETHVFHEIKTFAKLNRKSKLAFCKIVQ